jgi:NADPH-dependent curcumin reductase CurA
MHPMTENRQVTVATLPTGGLAVDNYALETVAVPAPGHGEALVRTLALTIGAGQRAGLQGERELYRGAHDPRRDGGTGVGRVEASNVDGISPGDLVVGSTGWQDYATLPARDARRVDPGIDPALHLSLFGTNGLTAYFGLL